MYFQNNKGFLLLYVSIQNRAQEFRVVTAVGAWYEVAGLDAYAQRLAGASAPSAAATARPILHCVGSGAAPADDRRST